MVDIPFIRAHELPTGRIQQLSQLVTCVTADNPGPYTYTGTGVFIIGNQDVAVIDPGPITPAHRAALDKALQGKSVHQIFLTHHHADHSPMAVPLAKKYGCKIYGHPVQNNPDNGVSELNLDAGADARFAPDITLKDGEQFHGPDWTLQAVHTPGHTSNHFCFALIEENTLFSGDHIMGWATSVVIPPGGHMGQYLQSLKKVQERHYDIIRPTHGAAITEVEPFLDAYIAHRYAREAQIVEALKAGHNGVMDIVTHLYTHIDKRLYPAAAMSVLSHLIHLTETGHVKADTLTLEGHYRLL